MKRALLLLALLPVFAAAGTITVTSPNEGDFLGASSSVDFRVEGAQRQVRVTATVTSKIDPNLTVRVEQRFTPDNEGKVTDAINLSFDESFVEGEYTVRVVADEPNNPGNPYNPVDPITVKVDVTKPRFGSMRPINNAYVRGNVIVEGTIQEPFLREWRVQVNGRDIPNNSGGTPGFFVTWTVPGTTVDGPQSVRIEATDEAGNTATKTMTVILDRVRPTISVLTPGNNASYRRSTSIPVAIDITDQWSDSLDVTGIDVLLQDTTGRVLGRVARVSFSRSGTKVAWNGRIRGSKSLPNTFRIVVRAWDKAGNAATQQAVTVRLN